MSDFSYVNPEAAAALAHLNPEQHKGAEIIDGQIQVIAGPGTGKTNLVISRIAYMIKMGIAAESILALTFTNKAAAEMRDRINRVCKELGYPVVVGTYHSFVSKYILGKNAHHDFFKQQGYPNGFITLDQDNADKLLDEARKSVPAEVAGILEAAGWKRKEIFSYLSKKRARGLGYDDVGKEVFLSAPEFKTFWGEAAQLALRVEKDDDLYALTELRKFVAEKPFITHMAVCHVWKEYSQRCKSVDGVDFDDMLILADRLLKHDPKVAKNLAIRFKYISLDEYQDTNWVQASLIDSIVKYHAEQPNIFTVGDGRQSIYKFRESDVGLMLNFNKRFNNVQSVSLVRNYRSSNHIIAAANMFAKEMAGQLNDGHLLQQAKINKPTNPVLIKQFARDELESDWIVNKIQQLLNDKVDANQIYLLYRNRSIKTELEKSLTSYNIDYEVIGDISFWERREVKDIVALSRLFVRRNDVMALARVLDSTKSGATGANFRKVVHEKKLQGWDALSRLGDKGGDRAKSLRTFIADFQSKKESCINGTDWHAFFKNYCYQEQIKGGDTDVEAKEFVMELFNYMQPHEREIFVNNFEPMVREIHSELPVITAIRTFWLKHMAPVLEEEDTKALQKKNASEEDIFASWERRVKNVDVVLSHLSKELFKGSLIDDVINEMTLRTENANTNEKPSVKLMTIHASKGLEAEEVFVVGAEQENFMRSEEYTTEDIDEEGRIFYVALTRGQHHVYITHADKRMVNGKILDMTPLEFLDVIKPTCTIEALERTGFTHDVTSNNSPNEFGALMEDTHIKNKKQPYDLKRIMSAF